MCVDSGNASDGSMPSVAEGRREGVSAVEHVIDHMVGCVRLIEAVGGERAEVLSRCAALYRHLAPCRRALGGEWVSAIGRIVRNINLACPILRKWGEEGIGEGRGSARSLA